MKITNEIIVIAALIFIFFLYVGLFIKFTVENVKWNLKNILKFIFMPFYIYILIPLILPVFVVVKTKKINKPYKKLCLISRMIILYFIINQKIIDLMIEDLIKKEDNKLFIENTNFKNFIGILTRKLELNYC